MPPNTAAPDIQWTEEQLAALERIDEWYRSGEPFFSLTGPAGVGKSTLLREVVRRFPTAGLTAMTGKAALRLSDCAGRSATTLHAALYFPPKPGDEVKFCRLRPPPCRFIVVDESSMMTPSVFAHLKVWDEGMRFLLVGDSYQLPPVITGEELKQFGEDYSVFTYVDGAVLKTVMRNAGGILHAATHVRERGDVYRKSVDNYQYVSSPDPLRQAVHEYCADPEDRLLITWRNATRMAANRLIRAQLGHDGPLPDVGEPVLIKRNGQGFLNGEIVTCGGFESGPMIGSVRTLWMWAGASRILVSFEGGNPDRGGEPFDGQMPWIVDWKAYHIDLQRTGHPEPTPITWGYCLTAHSAQGSEARRVTVFLERDDSRSSHFRKQTTLPTGEKAVFSSRWLYTSITRGKKHALMLEGR